MASPERRGIVEKAANFSKKVDIVTGIIGVLILSAPVIAWSMLGYLAGDAIENRKKVPKTS